MSMQTMVAVKRDGQWRSAASSGSRLWKIEQQLFLMIMSCYPRRQTPIR